MLCNGTKRDGHPCSFKAKYIHDDMCFCGFHTPTRSGTPLGRPPSRNLQFQQNLNIPQFSQNTNIDDSFDDPFDIINTPVASHGTTLALCSCDGLTKKGTLCKNFGKYIHNGLTFCHIHKPPDTFLLQDDPSITRSGRIEVNLDDKCPICFCNLSEHSIMKTNCGHFFHSQCFFQWTDAGNYTCPVCRTRSNISRYSIPNSTRRLDIYSYDS